jgi:hypothetical protein
VRVTILEAMQLPALFGAFFRDAESWAPWRAFLAALFGLPMTASELEIYRRHTGRERRPDGPAREGWVVAGRRAGKSLIAALVAIFVACFRSYASGPTPTSWRRGSGRRSR